ncbi:MAG: YciI family protein [Acidobacteriota bacterium]|nr:YciI family protein [Acidobacteriota bacterium]
MKKITIALALCLAFITIETNAQSRDESPKSEYDAALAERLGADDYGMRSYVYVLLKTGKADITDEKKRKEIFAGHFANMGRLAEEGLLVAAGPFDDPNGIKRGFFIYNVPSIEEAQKLVETDPGIQSGIFDYELTKLYSSAALVMINEIHKKIQKKAIN